jgi:subtilisin family serine protease
MFALVLPASAGADEPTTEIILKREKGLNAHERADLRQDAGVTLVDTLRLQRTEVVAAPAGEAAKALRELNADPDVVYAEENRLVYAFADPVRAAWALKNYGQDDGTGGDVFGTGIYDADVDAVEAWDQNTFDAVPVTGVDQRIAVVDSGVFDTHEDLDGQIAETHDFVGPASGAPGAPDNDGHGTHVAGIIAAKRNNGKGSAGLAPDAQIVALRALDGGQGSVADVAEALDYAGDAGIPIVNASLGGAGETSDTLNDVIAEHVATTLFVFAAGNGGGDSLGDDNDEHPIWPCDAPQDNVICVGASTNRDTRATFSNYGATSVDLFAPGEAIASTVPPGVIDGFDASVKYAYMDGTSMAAPYVTAAAALVRQADPNLGPVGIKDMLLATVDAKPAFDGISVTGGRLNAGLAVAQALAAGAPPIDADGDGVADAIDECEGVNGTAAGCPEDDSDGLPNDSDNCPADNNADQANVDGDADGDACDPDIDNDAQANSTDNCPRAINQTQADLDGDGLGDACDDDLDNDTRKNASDNCPRNANQNQADLDKDTVGDACDPDIDGDNDLNGADNCPVNFNPTQANRDGDRWGDACDADRDGDGRPNTGDGCPDVKASTATGCPPTDRDRDGHLDGSDGCPNEPAHSNDGCPLPAVTALSTTSRKHRASVSVRTSRAATVTITVQRKSGKRWRRVARTTLATSPTLRARLKTQRLRTGRYRAVVVLSSNAGRASAVIRRFRVR